VDFLKHLGIREPWPPEIKVPSWLPRFCGEETLGNGLESSAGGIYEGLAYREPPILQENDSNLQVQGIWLGAVDRIQDGIDKFEELDATVCNLLQHCRGSLADLGKHTAEYIHAVYAKSALLAMVEHEPEFEQNLESYFQSRSEDTVFHVMQLVSLTMKRKRTSFRFQPCHPFYLSAAVLSFGLGAQSIQVGDRLCLVIGCFIPLFLCRQDQRYVVIGNALMPGFTTSVMNTIKEFNSLLEEGVLENIKLC
jgi:hypothetical protein